MGDDVGCTGEDLRGLGKRLLALFQEENSRARSSGRRPRRRGIVSRIKPTGREHAGGTGAHGAPADQLCPSGKEANRISGRG
jgi:hypothetical protein